MLNSESENKVPVGPKTNEVRRECKNIVLQSL